MVAHCEFTWNCLKSKFLSIMLCTASPSLSSVTRSSASLTSVARWHTCEGSEKDERRGGEGRGGEGRGGEGRGGEGRGGEGRGGEGRGGEGRGGEGRGGEGRGGNNNMTAEDRHKCPGVSSPKLCYDKSLNLSVPKRKLLLCVWTTVELQPSILILHSPFLPTVCSWDFLDTDECGWTPTACSRDSVHANACRMISVK